MKKTTTLRALVLSMIMTFGLVLPMAAQNDGFFRNNDNLYNNRADAYSITNQTFGEDPAGITGGLNGDGFVNQTFGTPLGSGLLIMVAAGAGYVVARRKRARKGMTLLLAAAMLMGMTQCKKRIETVTPSQQHGTFITLRVNDDAKHQVITSNGEVHYTEGDIIYVANGGNLVGALKYFNTIPGTSITNCFAGQIGIDLLGDDEPLPLDPDDYLYFAFFGNAELDENNGVLSATISGQQDNLPVISMGKTEQVYGNYEASGISDFDCFMYNQCALVKFTFSPVNAAVGTLSGDDYVRISGVYTTALLNINAKGVTITPDPTSTGSINLYHPSDAEDNERWGILLPQTDVTGANMLIRNWKFTGNVNIDATANNDLHEETINCSGTPVKVDFFTSRRGKIVCFAPGNLQYQASPTGKWRFAENQWDVIGSSNLNISPSYTGWIDLFGFGTGDAPTKTLTTEADYAAYNDWGNYCGDPTNNGYTWYTPNMAEWLCLINWRPNNDAIALGYQDDIRVNKGGPATVHGIKGFVLIPDYFDWPTEYPQTSFTPKTYGDTSGWNDYEANEFTDAQWAAMEANGAVFLPGGGLRRYEKNNNDWEWYYDNTGGRLFGYWAYNPYWKEYQANVFSLASTPTIGVRERYTGASVRLARMFEF